MFFSRVNGKPQIIVISILVLSLSRCDILQTIFGNIDNTDNNNTTKITSPQNGDSFAVGTTIKGKAEATNDDEINKVSLYVDNELHSSDQSSPYKFSLTGLEIGSHSLYVRALDFNGDTTDSSKMNVSIGNTTPPGNGDGYNQTVKITVTRIDARPKGHPLDSGTEPDPIIDVAFMQAEGAAGSSADKIQITGPSVIRVPDWIPDSEKTHPTAKYYMYFAAHGSNMISLAWAKSITGEWHLFNRGDASNCAWGKNGNYTGAATPGTGVLDLMIGEPDVMWFDDNFGVDDHIASPDVVLDDENERIILYFHGPMHKIIGLKGTGNFVATSKWGLNFNLQEEGGEKNQGPRNVLVAGQYVKTFEVEGEDNGQKVMRTFAFVNGSDLWAAPIRTKSGSIASHANADEKGGYFTPSWPGDPTPIEHPDQPGKKPYWWENYKSWTDANPFKGVIKAPELVPPDNDILVRKHNQDPRHWGIYHDPANDRDRVYAFYTCRRDLPESIVVVIFGLAGLTETERLDPSLWKRVSDVEQVLLKPELVWEGVADYKYAHSASGGGHGYQFRDPDIFKDKDGKLYLFYCGKGEGAIGVAEVKIETQVTKKSLNVTSPFRGYTCLIGKKRNIGWETTGDISKVDIEYTVNGKNWIGIAKGVKNTHYYTWTIPNTPSDIAQVRIKETGGDLVSVSDPFFIAAKKTLFMVRPTEGTSVLADSEYGLNWAIVGDIAKVDLAYTLNGSKWITIAKSVSNPGPYAWTVPNIKENNVMIRISETNGSVKSISDPFKIVK